MKFHLFVFIESIVMYQYICLSKGLSGSGQLCLSCQKTVLPRDCNAVTRCSAHEECMVEKYISEGGSVWYNVGCMSTENCAKVGKRSTVSMCVNCCRNKDLCNGQGCGTQDFDPNTVKRCYSCRQHLKPDSCDEIEVCSSNKECALIQIHFGPDTFYESLCTEASQCGQITSKGIVECCSGSLCNNKYANAQITSLQSTFRATVTNPPVTTSTSVSNCLSNWIPGGTTNRYCDHKNAGAVNWHVAKGICEAYGTHLPVIITREQLDTLANISRKEDIWLDGTDDDQEGVWIWSSTGKPVSGFHWSPNQPDNFYGDHTENCLEFGDGYGLMYNDAPCSRDLYVKCEDGYLKEDANALILAKPKAVPKRRSLHTETLTEMKCPSNNWHSHDGSLYCVIEKRNVNWFTAKDICVSLHAHLPIVNSDADHNFLRGEISHGEIWLDGTEHNQHGRWIWETTKTAITYSHWAPGQPDNYHGNQEECLEFGEAYGWRWNDAPCSDTGRTTKLICQRQQPGYILGRR